MLDEATIRRLFYEEAAKRDITLGAEPDIDWMTYANATEDEARTRFSGLLAGPAIAGGVSQSRWPSFELDDLRDIQRAQARRDDLFANPNEGDPEWDEAWQQALDELTAIQIRRSQL